MDLSNFRKAFYALFFSVITVGCHLDNANEQPTAIVTDVEKLTEVKMDFSQIDSVECVYSKGAKENKQTASFFIKDALFINTLKSDLTATQKQAAECAHDVKLYLYKNGDIYKTIYAALNPQCNYLAYAINGKSYFVPLSFKLHQLLRTQLATVSVNHL